MWVTNHNEQTELSRFWVIPEIRGVECGSREKVVKNLMFFSPKIWG